MTKLNDLASLAYDNDSGNSVKKNSYEERLSPFLTPERLATINNLEKINASVAELYSTTIYILENEFPLYQTFVAHGVREMVNNLTRTFKGLEDVGKSKKEVNVFFDKALPNSSISEKHLSDVVENIVEGDKKEGGGKEFKKVKLFLEHHVNNQNGRNLDHYAKVIVEFKKDKFLPLVHNSENTKPREIFKNNFYIFEELLTEVWGSLFLKRKKEVDGLFNKRNPTVENINTLMHALRYKKIESYFFTKLENPEWLEPLNKKGLLVPRKNWQASPFLIKVAHLNPNKVFEIIRLFLENELKKGREVDQYVLQGVLQIAVKFPDTNTSHTVGIANAFKAWINKVDSISDMIGIKEIGKLLESLEGRKKKKLALEILEAILKLSADTSIVDFSSYGGSKEVAETSINTRFSSNHVMGNDCYEELLNNGKNTFVPDQSFDLFKCLYSILLNPLKHHDLSERKYHPFAIEDHEQDKYNTDPVYLIIAGIRDSAESVLENDHDKVEEVFTVLEKDKNKIFTRIILHLLKKYPEKNAGRIERYLSSKDLFDSSIIHHEYYLLLQKEFGNISESSQNKILKYIDKGPDLTYCEGREEELGYSKPWTLARLNCIKANLTGKKKEEYEGLIKELGESKNPEFLLYNSGAFWVGEKSPQKEEDFKEMSVQKIVEYLKKWQPTGVFGSETRR